MSDALAALAAEVGPASAGPVVAVGSRSAFDVGGPVAAGCREVRAPAGIVEFEPAEMTVRVRAGTTIDDLDAALGERGQFVALPAGPRTVGGVVAVGRSGRYRLGYGPVRDAVLEIRYVGADGALVKAGGPTVKNVSGFDLVRLLVGSLGTLGVIGEVVLRTRPVPATSGWYAGPGDPFELLRTLHRPAALLWDGTTTWARLEGDAADVARQAAESDLEPSAGPPPDPPHRWSLPPAALRRLDGPFLAQVGVGIVHRDEPPPRSPVDEQVAAIHRRLKDGFDPTGRLAPGRDVLAA
jgi:glycolate oxidase FAD binding subunit